jgi:hypothetical protein
MLFQIEAQRTREHPHRRKASGDVFAALSNMFGVTLGGRSAVPGVVFPHETAAERWHPA